MKKPAAVLWSALALALALGQPVYAADATHNPVALTTCPEPDAMQVEHLYGLWRAEFRDPATARVIGTATLLFERHAEFAQSVSGASTRDGVQTRVSGDVEAGSFNLDESVDGVNISATWSGTVVPQTCGKEIRGTWIEVSTQTTREFVLRKLPGWQ